LEAFKCFDTTKPLTVVECVMEAECPPIERVSSFKVRSKQDFFHSTGCLDECRSVCFSLSGSIELAQQ